MVVCICKSFSKDKLLKIISSGAQTIEELEKETGVCTDCGCCRKAVQKLLSQKDENAIDNIVVKE